MFRASKFFAVVLALSPVAGSASAQPALYEFVQGGSGDVLATLELSMLPAGLTDIETLTFTPEGEAIFGLGPVYGGSFDTSNVVLDDDGSGRLEALFPGGLLDVDPPDVGVFEGHSDTEFVLLFLGPGTDAIAATVDINSQNIVLATSGGGEWRSVPEPTSLAVLGIGGLALLSRRRR